MNDWIEVQGARTHNLKNIDLKLPKQAISVLIGPSGSGKSSLAMDTLYAEGSRRYLESLSLHSRQQFSQLAHAEVDQILGLSPSVELKAMKPSPGARSSVGTQTEIDSLLRTLFFKGSEIRCPHCQEVLKAWTIAEIVDELLDLKAGLATYLIAPVLELKLEQWMAQGILRILIEDEIYLLEDLSYEDLADVVASKKKMALVVDRFKIAEKHRSRIWEAVESALKFSVNQVGYYTQAGSRYFSLTNRCSRHDFSLELNSKKVFSFNSINACETCQGLGELQQLGHERAPLCPSCQGKRLQDSVLQAEYHSKNIAELSLMPLDELVQWLRERTHLRDWEKSILTEIQDRLEVLLSMGLGYLHLYRSIPSLSSGEFQRIRIATQIGSRMSGICYFLDEPLSGLHLKDQERLWKQLEQLRDQGNTLVLVEHSRFAIQNADYLVELGPGAGSEGGEILYAGKSWLTAATPGVKHWRAKDHFSSNHPSQESFSGKTSQSKILRFKYPNYYTIKQGEILLQKEAFQVIAGVSGSGKSTLMMDLIYPYLESKGLAILVESTPLRGGRRSSPASLMGVMDLLRQLYAKLPHSKLRGYSAARFSLNKKGGRCEHCAGEGILRVEIDFAAGSEEPCEYCQGTGFNRPTLEILFKGHSIAQVLEMDIDYATRFFRDQPKIFKSLSTVLECGLGHLQLGASANQLSQGEMQRLKLARELQNLKSDVPTWILLDEPSRGLFFDEVQHLIRYLKQLSDLGHSVLVVDHHPDVILAAQKLFLMGPGSGVQGGELIDSKSFRQDLYDWLSQA